MHWKERIEAARERGESTPDEIDLALSWPDCACGEQDPRIPRNSIGEPKDAELCNLGCSFAAAIEDNAFDAAEQLLEEIEQRSREIIAAM